MSHATLARLLAVGLITLLAIGGCAPPQASGGGADRSETGTVSGPKRMTAAIRGNPHTVYQKLNPRSNVPGVNSIELMVTTGLTIESSSGSGRTAWLAEAAPTTENGLWRLLPDGTMETRWTIRPGVVWHDGVPLTSQDLLFTAEISRDRNLPILGNVAYQSLGAVEAIDERTVVARWVKPYIKADQLFSASLALPVAKHRLEEAYASFTDQESFIGHAYWSTDFVGTGPFKLKSWEQGSHLVLEANDRYALGRPKLDEITVKFIADPNTLAANILAGEVDMPMGGRIDIEWGMTVADQWRGGVLDTQFGSMLQIFVQHINPSPPIVGNVEFKRAMVHALDRQEMSDQFMLGLSSVGHTFVSPKEPEYPALESALVKYDYDPRRALQLLEGLGYTQGSDGALRDRSGQRLALQIRTSQGDLRQEKPMFASADYWQKLGVEVDRHYVVPQRATDAEYRSTFPAFDVKGQAGTMDYATSFHSSRISLPENNFLVSGNNSRYNRPEMDQAIDRYFTTIPWDERMQWGRQIVRMLSEDVGWIGLYYEVGPVLKPNRVFGIATGRTEVEMLNTIHEWDIRG